MSYELKCTFIPVHIYACLFVLTFVCLSDALFVNNIAPLDSLCLFLREGRGQGYNAEGLICPLHDGENQCDGPGAGAGAIDNIKDHCRGSRNSRNCHPEA